MFYPPSPRHVTPADARWMAATLRRNATREVDQKEIAGLLAELDAKAQSAGAGEA